MQHDLTYRQHTRAVLGLGLPLIGSHVAQIAIHMTDAAMLGWYSVEALDAEVLGSTLFFVIFIMGTGFAQAVMPMVASALSSGESTRVRRVTRMGMWASLLFGIVAMPLMIWSGPLLIAAGQAPVLSALASQYLNIAGWGLLPALQVMVLKSYLAAQERTRAVLWITVAAVGLNVVINYALIFGNLGFPEMGVQGAALASLLVATASFVVLAVHAARTTPEYVLFQRIWRPDWEAFKQVVHLGWPIGLTSLAEAGLFAASTIMMGWFGKIPLAAHGIALQVTSVMFMVHLGLSNAGTIRAGQAYGRNDCAGLRKGAKVVLMLSAGFALCTVVLFLMGGEFMIGLFLGPHETDRQAVIALGGLLLAAAALFQLMDAAQVMGLGLLRGVQDTRIPLLIAVISYWGIGVTMSYVLGFRLGYGGVGIWIGLAIGLAFAGVLLLWRFWGWSSRLQG